MYANRQKANLKVNILSKHELLDFEIADLVNIKSF